MHARVDLGEREAVRASLLDRVSAVIAVIALIALVAKLVLASDVAEERRALAKNQQKIAQAQLLAQVNNRLIQMLASASVQANDASLRQLLASNGVSFTIRPNAAAQAGAAPPPTPTAPETPQ